jgi:dolichol-phosphate mannosyltransferase
MNHKKHDSEVREISSAVIVLPTYNEATNVKNLLDKIYYNELRYNRNKSNSHIDLMVLVVDDSSPDGTANIVKEYQAKNPKVKLLVRKEKKGLGAAYINGFEFALKNLNPDVILEMDADGQHNPDDIFRLIGEIKNGSDFVIGSRYIKGGKISGKWGLKKRFKSYCAGLITRVGLGLGGIIDTSGGFRAIHNSVLRKINLKKLGVKGYAFQASLLEAAKYHGFKIKEIPITFNQRIAGESKMRFQDMMEGWSLVFKRRIERIQGRGP